MPNGITNDKRKGRKFAHWVKIVVSLLPTHRTIRQTRQYRNGTIAVCVRMYFTTERVPCHAMPCYFGYNFSSSFFLQICCRLMIDWSCISCHLRLICILISNKLHSVKTSTNMFSNKWILWFFLFLFLFYLYFLCRCRDYGCVRCISLAYKSHELQLPPPCRSASLSGSILFHKKLWYNFTNRQMSSVIWNRYI